MINYALQSSPLSATDALRDATLAFKKAGIETAALDARLLLQHALGITREEWIAGSERRLDSGQRAAYRELTRERLRRRPVAQLTGKREFWGLAFRVTPDTLDPRSDSETLIEAVLDRVRGRGGRVNILDLGTGTGCLLLALLSEYPQARGVGVDISEEALRVARENAVNLGLTERAVFARSNWGDALSGLHGSDGKERFDIVISNPPYIPSGAIASLAPELRHEPGLALDGGEDGLAAYRAIARQLPFLLAENGVAALEIGMGQERDVSAIAVENGLLVAAVRKDMAGIARCVVINS